MYSSLNQMLDYIEEHLKDEIDYTILANFLGVNVYTMERFFSLLFNMTLTEYIRNRRLSSAFNDLFYTNEKVIDVAFKYGYENPTSFSRAFYKFHGIKPSIAKKDKTHFRHFPKFHFEEDISNGQSLSYIIREVDSFTLYGKGIAVTEKSIRREAPKFFSLMKQKYGLSEYGMVVYEKRFYSDKMEYWVLNKEERKDLKAYVIPASKWIIFRIDSLNFKRIQELSDHFYFHFFPTCSFNLASLPELEVYYDTYMEMWIPIKTD